MPATLRILTSAIHRFHHDCAGKILTQHRHQVELPFLFHARFLGEVIAEVAFRQQVPKKTVANAG